MISCSTMKPDDSRKLAKMRGLGCSLIIFTTFWYHSPWHKENGMMIGSLILASVWVFRVQLLSVYFKRKWPLFELFWTIATKLNKSESQEEKAARIEGVVGVSMIVFVRWWPLVWWWFKRWQIKDKGMHKVKVGWLLMGHRGKRSKGGRRLEVLWSF
jgi:hypothetical protein